MIEFLSWKKTQMPNSLHIGEVSLREILNFLSVDCNGGATAERTDAMPCGLVIYDPCDGISVDEWM